MSGSHQTITGILALGLALLATPAAAETLIMGGTGTSLALAQELGKAFSAKNPGVVVNIPPSVGSGGGVRALLAGQFGLSFSARPLKNTESAKGAVAAPLCRTPFVLAVSDQVTGDLSVSSDGLLDIFARRVTEWPDGTAINLVFRPPSETGAALLEAQFPGLAELFQQGRESRGAIVAYSDQEMMNIGERNVGSLVFGALAAIKAERRRLRPLSLDGVVPSAETLADGTYPMDFVLHTVLGPKSNDTARRFQEFTKSQEAAAILHGLDCQSLNTEPPAQPGEIVPRGQHAPDDDLVAYLSTGR